jgi:ribosome-associated protein
MITQNTLPHTLSNLKDFIMHSLDEMKAESIVCLDIQAYSQFADFMIFSTGNSNRHTHAIAHALIKTLKPYQIKPYALEGLSNSEWILIDFGNIIVHIMLPETRQFYNLESLWANPV